MMFHLAVAFIRSGDCKKLPGLVDIAVDWEVRTKPSSLHRESSVSAFQAGAQCATTLGTINAPVSCGPLGRVVAYGAKCRPDAQRLPALLPVGSRLRLEIR